MRVLVAIDLDDDDILEAYGTPGTDGGAQWDDLVASLDARADEFYCGEMNNPVRGRVAAACDVTDVLPEFIAATEVGADGIDDEDKRGHIFGSLVTFQQGLNV